MRLKKIAVIGLGNTLRRDDGIGVIILESLFNFYKREGVDYLNFGIASFDLIYRLKDYQAVLLLDGIEAGLKPGELKIAALDEIIYNSESSCLSSHELNLKNIFDLSQKLKLKTQIYAAGIQVQDAAYGEGLTPKLSKRIKLITQEISSFIDQKLCNSSAVKSSD